MKKYSSLFWYVALFMLVFLTDRATKFYVLNNQFSQFKLMKFLEFDLVFNRGMSWGMLDSKSDILFICVSAFICLVTLAMGVYAYFRFKNGQYIVPEVVVIAGSLSNIFDRVVYKGVIDFIVVYCDFIPKIGRINFPVFNFADMFIFLGVVFITINVWRESK
jgi:signal peptidase II